MRLKKGLPEWPWHCFLATGSSVCPSVSECSARVQLFLATLILPGILISILFLEIKASIPFLIHIFAFENSRKEYLLCFRGSRERERSSTFALSFIFVLFDLEKGGKSCSPIIVRNTISSSLFLSRLRGFRSLFSPPLVFASSNVPFRFQKIFTKWRILVTFYFLFYFQEIKTRFIDTLLSNFSKGEIF